MIHKDEAIKKGIKIIDSKESHNALFENLKTHFPQTIKDNQVDLHAIATLLGLETKANIQGYELTFTGKALANALYSTPTQKLLKFEESFNVRSAESSKEDSNFIIKGDNLDVLKILKSAYSEKIKMIYIDPPYNTKNDNFIYPDNFRKDYKAILQEVGLLEIDDEGNEVESETLQFFKNIQGSRTHSGWLAFMLPRLKLARDLLREDGVIFISIDDNEQANLKILCDEIFGEENFVFNFSRLTSSQRPSQEKYASTTHDFLLCYAKNKEYSCFERVIKRDLSNVEFDEIGRFIAGDTGPILASVTQGYSKGGDYDFEYNGKIYSPIDKNGKRRRWLWSRERMEEAKKLGILVETKSGLRVRNYIDMEFEVGTNKMIPKSPNLILTSLDLYNTDFTNNHGTSNLSELGMGDCFNFPKPVSLIAILLKLLDLKNDIILDFFAGSGTTAHAVMELNAKDNGNRKFILVQIDEPINESKNKVAYDFCKNELKSKNPAISDITIERVKRAGVETANANPNFSVSFSVLALSDKPELISTKKGALELLNNENLSPFDKALNLALQSGKTLDKPLKTIFENRLYQCEDCLYLIACDREVLEFLRKSQNEYIFIDGFEDINLEDFLNLDSSLNDRLRVAY